MNKKVSVAFALVVIIIVVIFFGSLAIFLNKQANWQANSVSLDNFQKEISKKNTQEKNKKQSENQAASDVVSYTNKEIGFGLIFPKDDKKYMVKELNSKGKNRAIIFGLPISDEEIIKNKKENYGEIFRIELVPISDMEKSKNKTCADKNRQFPLCDNDDVELGRNDQFAFIYTRYDKLDVVEKSKTKMIPSDFDASVFSKADEIAKSFRWVLTQSEAVNKNM